MFSTGNSLIARFMRIIFLSWILLWMATGPVFALQNKCVGIIYSGASANLFCDGFADVQLSMVMQNETSLADIHYELLDEKDINDETDVSNLLQYNALILPSMRFVTTAKYTSIAITLRKVVDNGVGLTVSGIFLTSADTSIPYPEDTYTPIKYLLGIERAGSRGNKIEGVAMGSARYGFHACGTDIVSVQNNINENVHIFI